MASSRALQRTAQAWCLNTTQHLEMDPVLAEAFAAILDHEWSQPLLGNATNAQLLEELKVRIEVHWSLDYKTTGRDEDYVPATDSANSLPIPPGSPSH